MSKNYFGRKLTAQEIAIVESKIPLIREEIGFVLGDPVTYELLNKVQIWIMKHFRYESDGYIFNKEDMWSTIVFDLMVLEGIIEDDCDGFGYAIIEFAIRILQINPNRVYRVACAAETGEGHFVTWIKADDGVTYQLENRVRKPRTVKYMHELGYEYWYYSPMDKKHISKNLWKNAPQKVMNIIYETPRGQLQADEDNDMTFSEVVQHIPNSRTLQFGTGVAGATVFGSTLTSLATQSDWKIPLIFAVTGLIVAGGIFYTRMITTKPLRSRRNGLA